jgi:hypothetical protein
MANKLVADQEFATSINVSSHSRSGWRAATLQRPVRVDVRSKTLREIVNNHLAEKASQPDLEPATGHLIERLAG